MKSNTLHISLYFHLMCFTFLWSPGFRSCERLVHGANRTIANELEQNVRILCAVVQTYIDPNRKLAIEHTWGKRCNKLFYLTTEDGCIRLDKFTTLCDSEEKEKKEWQMAKDHDHCASIYERFPSGFEWYLLINSEGYIIPENMRYMLAEHDPDRNIYFMSNVKKAHGLNLILSRKALDTFAHADIKKLCTKGEASYQNKAKCFSAIGLTAANSRDSWGRDRILPENPYFRVYLPGYKKFWYCDRFIKPNDSRSRVHHEVNDCFSDFAVSFDSVDSQLVYVIDFLIYQLRPHGINYHFDEPKILVGSTPAKMKDHHTKQKVNPAKTKDHHTKQKFNHPTNKDKDQKDNVCHPSTKARDQKDNVYHPTKKDKDQKDNVYHPSTKARDQKDNVYHPSTKARDQKDNVYHPSTKDGDQKDNVYHPSTKDGDQKDNVYHPSTKDGDQKDNVYHPSTKDGDQKDNVYHPSTKDGGQKDNVYHPSTKARDQKDNVYHPSTKARDQKDNVYHPSTKARDQKDNVYHPSTKDGDQKDNVYHPSTKDGGQKDKDTTEQSSKIPACDEYGADIVDYSEDEDDESNKLF